jgi:hypothetical protein
MANAGDSHRMTFKLQFHYWFSDKSHTMDALIHNKCERELLELTKAIAKICGVNVKMETEPSGKGGLKSWLTITVKSPKKTAPAKIALVNTVVAACVAATGQTSMGEMGKALLDSLAGNASEEASKEQLQKEIHALKNEFANLLPLLDQSSVVKKRRSTFYDLLRNYQKVKSISVALTDETKKPITEEQLVAKEEFKAFIISSNTVAPQVVENAEIEIISPVLMKGKHKWRGMYKGEPISFVMKSDDFMTLVQSGKVEFKSGSTIACTLQIEKKINGVGVEKIMGYNILGVASYSENGKIIETPEAKQKQKQAVVSKRQLDLFG